MRTLVGRFPQFHIFPSTGRLLASVESLQKMLRNLFLFVKKRLLHDLRALSFA